MHWIYVKNWEKSKQWWQEKIMRNSSATWIWSYILNEMTRKIYTHIVFTHMKRMRVYFRLTCLYTFYSNSLSRPTNRSSTKRQTLISRYRINLHNWLIIKTNYPIIKWCLGLSTPMASLKKSANLHTDTPYNQINQYLLIFNHTFQRMVSSLFVFLFFIKY